MTHCAAADIALFQSPESVAFRACLIDLPQRDIHEVVTVDEMPIECLSILQLNQLD